MTGFTESLNKYFRQYGIEVLPSLPGKDFGNDTQIKVTGINSCTQLYGVCDAIKKVLQEERPMPASERVKKQLAELVDVS